jgi:hypothetical protein
MKFNDFIVSEEKVRLDPKCWTGKKIGNPKTKVKGGVRVNNCVPAESVEEAANAAQQAATAIAKKKKAGVDEAAPPGAKAERMVKHIKKGYAKDGKLSDKEKSIAYATAWKAHNKGVTEGTQRVDSLVTDALKIMQGSEASDAVAALKTVLGDREYNSRRGYYNFYVRQLMDMSGQQGMAESALKEFAPVGGDDREPNEEEILRQLAAQWWNGTEQQMSKAQKTLAAMGWEIGQDESGNDDAGVFVVRAGDEHGDSYMAFNHSDLDLNEGSNPEYDDEAGMADNNLETLDRAVEGIDRLIDSGDNLPEWCQEKIAVAKSMLVAVWDYMYSEEASDEVDPEVDEMFEAMDQLAEEMAIKNRVSKDLVWEQFEAMPDNMLYETAAWRRKEGKSKKGGLNAKGVASYRRENPGSKLQTAVTTKPSKLKPGSKAAKRRKSFCARMGGVKGPMKKPNGKPTRKALALRKWNC